MKMTPIQVADCDMRDETRKHVLMQATIISVEGPQRAYVRDLTSTGARIQCDQRLEEDWDVVFKRGEQFVAARVAWSTKHEAGLQFYRELASGDVSEPARSRCM
jgi:hypothetical protein